MNPNKAEQLFIVMKQYGVSHFKTLDLEIRMEGVIVSSPMEPKEIKKVVPSQAIPPVEQKIPHHVNEVANLLKLNDNDLVDKLFPDYSQAPPKREDS